MEFDNGQKLNQIYLALTKMMVKVVEFFSILRILSANDRAARMRTDKEKTSSCLLKFVEKNNDSTSQSMRSVTPLILTHRELYLGNITAKMTKLWN